MYREVMRHLSNRLWKVHTTKIFVLYVVISAVIKRSTSILGDSRHVHIYPNPYVHTLKDFETFRM
jgi:hypothetical protein